MMKLRQATLLLFAASLLVSVGLIVYPMVVIQPFRRQGVTELNVALWIIQWRSYFEAAAVAGVALALVWYWRQQASAWGRRRAILAAVIVCAAAALSRVNVFEIMFHRYDRPTFSEAAQSKLDANDKVLAIALNNHARAYPIRTIAYHHIINDEVGGIPVVATY